MRLEGQTLLLLLQLLPVSWALQAGLANHVQAMARIVNIESGEVSGLDRIVNRESEVTATTPETTLPTTTSSTTTTTSAASPSTSATSTSLSSTTSTAASATTPHSTTTTTTTTTTGTTTGTTTVTTTSVGSTPSPEPNHHLPGWATATILLAVTTVLLLLLGLFLVRRRRSKIPLARPVDLFRKSTVAQGSSPMRTDVFGVMYQSKLAQGQLSKEFDLVQEFSARINSTKTKNVGQAEINQNRNRFVDIIPYDDNYVSLQAEQGLPPSTYVNASYVDDLEGVGRVIVTQGPKQNTVLDFWRMVVEHRARHVVMLTNTQEGGRLKCVQYWPPHGQILHFDDISLLTLEEEEVHPGLIRRRVEVRLESDHEDEEGEVHTVTQLHLTSWPDHGVPDEVSSLLAFLSVATSCRDSGYSVVHCSAGVGRTGTFLALQHLTEQVKAGETSLDVLGTVLLLRELRPKMVQSLQQYCFLYQALDTFIKLRERGEDALDSVLVTDPVLEAGVDNFGFEHLQL